MSEAENDKCSFPSCFPVDNEGNSPAKDVHFRVTGFDSPEAASLLAGADACNNSLYGHADQSPIDPTQFTPAAGGLFLVAYLDGEPAACGGFRHAEPPASSEVAEIKRVFVVEAARRRGLARGVLTALEDAARVQGYRRIILDVGHKQSAAHALYESVGYHRIPGFTIYRDVPGNRAYAKDL